MNNKIKKKMKNIVNIVLENHKLKDIIKEVGIDTITLFIGSRL